jgi:hypothetical protein
MNARRRENEDWRRELVVLKTVAQVGCRVVCVGGKEDAVKWAARPGAVRAPHYPSQEHRGHRLYPSRPRIARGTRGTGGKGRASTIRDARRTMADLYWLRGRLSRHGRESWRCSSGSRRQACGNSPVSGFTGEEKKMANNYRVMGKGAGNQCRYSSKLSASEPMAPTTRGNRGLAKLTDGDRGRGLGGASGRLAERAWANQKNCDGAPPLACQENVDPHR